MAGSTHYTFIERPFSPLPKIYGSGELAGLHAGAGVHSHHMASVVFIFEGKTTNKRRFPEKA